MTIEIVVDGEHHEVADPGQAGAVVTGALLASADQIEVGRDGGAGTGLTDRLDRLAAVSVVDPAGDDEDSADADDVADAVEEVEEDGDQSAGSEPDETEAADEGHDDSEGGADQTADDLSTTERVRQQVIQQFDTGDEFQSTDVDIDRGGRVVGQALGRIARDDDEPQLTKRDTEQGTPSVWVVGEAVDEGGDDDIDDDDQDDSDDEPDDGDDGDGESAPARWCGYCGAGPFEGDAGVDDHHDEEDHPGDPAVKESDPAEADWIAATEEADGEGTEEGAQGHDVYKRCPQCDVACETTLEWYVHRTEEHGVPQAQLQNLEPGEFESIVEDADTVGGIFEAVPWSNERTLRMLGIYGLDDVVGGNVELSNLTDVEFDGVDDARDQEDEQDTDQETTTDDPDPEPEQERDRPDPDDPDFEGAAYRGGVAADGGGGS